MNWNGPETEAEKMILVLKELWNLDWSREWNYRGRNREIGVLTDQLMKFWKAEDFPRFKAQAIIIKRIFKELDTPDAALDAAPIKQEEPHD